jgi:CheY-like chemotaxis protein
MDQSQAQQDVTSDGETAMPSVSSDPVDYFSHMRHEMRTPVNAILGYSEMLLEDVLGQGQEALAPDLRRINSAGRKLLALIGQLQNAPVACRELENLSVQPRPSACASAQPDDAPPVQQSSNLLVVDDNETNRDVLSRRLIRQGHVVSLAENGIVALEMLRAQSFDLVLLDIMMPQMDGYEVLKRIKADPNMRHIPVVMLSALTELDSIVRCIEMGAEDYLPKPFNTTLLRARIDACLVKKRYHDQELAYMRDAALVTSAAAALEAGAFVPGMLSSVAAREDELGKMACMFEKMAAEVQAREMRLQMQLQQLTIQIDEQRKEREVAEITETDYFQQLQQRAVAMRRRQTPNVGVDQKS